MFLSLLYPFRLKLEITILIFFFLQFLHVKTVSNKCQLHMEAHLFKTTVKTIENVFFVLSYHLNNARGIPIVPFNNIKLQSSYVSSNEPTFRSKILLKHNFFPAVLLILYIINLILQSTALKKWWEQL